MANDLNSQHLSAERIEAFLEGELPQKEATALEEHASSCGRCGAELEAWQLLFSELGQLPRMAPAAGFRKRVMKEVEVRAPLIERLKRWVTGRGAAVAGTLGHLSPEKLQDYVEGLLPAGQMARVQWHLEECPACQRQEASWRSVFASLETLPRLEPPHGFAQRVMAQVPVSTPAPAGTSAPVSDWIGVVVGGALDNLRPLSAPALAMARKAWPQTRRAWSVVGGVMAAPAALMAAVIVYVASNPLLSAGNLATFAWWKGSEMLGAFGRSLADALVQSSLATEGYALMEQATGSAGLLAGTAAGFCVLTVISLYVLYRNLITTRPVKDTYVHFSF